ncbi:MAG: mechanosensitive ion channel family protein, partial [Muribaculaceae bacterium]|nr:mechanosensitive ion channel family protein [Muribaculaceae bacterium]
DALWQGTSRRELAEQYIPILTAKINDLKESYNLWEIVKRAALFILVIVAQYLLFRLTNYLFRKLRRQIIRFKQQRLKPIIIRDYELLNTRRLGRILIFFSNILRYIVLLIQLMFSVPMLFAIFPQTEKLALTIFLYIIDPIKMVLKSIVDYIPNLFIIIVIWYCIKYIIKGLHYISNEIKNEKLKIAGFYPDWAQPTFNIIRFLLYAFMVAMIYPYLPGSNSGVFQGISVFVGLIISLGSSTVIGNIIAGLVITYMRPFKLGDRIKLNDTTGNVIEKTPFVTRLRTPKNEVVTIPNSFIMSSHTVNYSASARQFGLIIHTSVTIGYDVPWRQVHQLLINAARMTPGVLEHPKPFVLETELHDYYPCYQINAYINDADHIGDIMSDLHQNIQDIFNEAGVEIMSPGYIATRDGNASTIPADYLKMNDPQ